MAQFSTGSELLEAPPTETIERTISGRIYRLKYWAQDVRGGYFTYRDKPGINNDLKDARLVQVCLVNTVDAPLLPQDEKFTTVLAAGNRPLIQALAIEIVKLIKSHEPSVEDAEKNFEATPSDSGSAVSPAAPESVLTASAATSPSATSAS